VVQSAKFELSSTTDRRMLGLTVPHVGVDEVIASAVCCGALWSRLAHRVISLGCLWQLGLPELLSGATPLAYGARSRW
jgi:hypothetical protein